LIADSFTFEHSVFQAEHSCMPGMEAHKGAYAEVKGASQSPAEQLLHTFILGISEQISLMSERTRDVFGKSGIPVSHSFEVLSTHASW
jgi:hypothetical protein